MMDKWESLIGDIKAEKIRQRPCSVRTLLDSLDEKARGHVTIALGVEGQGISHQALHEALRERVGNTAPSAFSIGRHRRGQCSCKVAR
jgi:hypothetical protein